MHEMQKGIKESPHQCNPTEIIQLNASPSCVIKARDSPRRPEYDGSHCRGARGVLQA
jgi:hypothetical protein